MSGIITASELNKTNNRQQVIDVLRATFQYRSVVFGKERRFQAIDLRCKSNKWQVLDSDGKWYSSFWCDV